MDEEEYWSTSVLSNLEGMSSKPAALLFFISRMACLICVFAGGSIFIAAYVPLEITPFSSSWSFASSVCSLSNASE
jgi:hypothetical protein